MLVVVGIVIGGVVVATGGSEVEAEVSGSVTSLPVVKYEGKVPVSRLVIEVSSFSFGEVVITEVSDSETGSVKVSEGSSVLLHPNNDSRRKKLVNTEIMHFCLELKDFMVYLGNKLKKYY